MRVWLILSVGVTLTLNACVARIPEATAIPVTSTPRSAPALPPTWTASPQPTAEPAEGGEAATGTPTPTPTERPQSTRIPLVLGTPTPDLTSIQCTATANDEGIELMTAPYFADNRIVPTMEPGFPYQAVQTYPTMVRLLRNGSTAGWIDYRLIAVDFEGADCFAQPRYQGDLTDFDSLCFMYADPPVEAYRDRELTEPMQLEVGATPHYVVHSRSGDLYSSCVGHAGPCFVVEADSVEITGACKDVPRSAEVAEEAQLFSEPDSESEVIAEIDDDEVVSVQAESQPGEPPAGAGEEGEWRLIKYYVEGKPRSGWLWSGWIDYR